MVATKSVAMVKVISPDTADLSVKADMCMADDPSKAVALTVHTIQGECLGNVWIRRNNQWEQLLPARVFPASVSVRSMLAGELVRFTANPGMELVNDVMESHAESRFSWVVDELHFQIERLAA